MPRGLDYQHHWSVKSVLGKCPQPVVAVPEVAFDGTHSWCGVDSNRKLENLELWLLWGLKGRTFSEERSCSLGTEWGGCAVQEWGRLSLPCLRWRPGASFCRTQLPSFFHFTLYFSPLGINRKKLKRKDFIKTWKEFLERNIIINFTTVIHLI